MANGAGLVARILIVEDEAQVLVLAKSALQQAGHEVISAATPAEAEAVIDDTAQKASTTWRSLRHP